jgi:signal transduction histidine kinase
LIADDLTKGEQLQKLEVETSNLRLVRHMADRLTNEIGNALVPLSVHQQVLAEKLKGGKADSEFLKMMNRELAESVRRVTRLANQLRFLARETPLAAETFPLGPVLEEAYQEARKHQPTKAADLTIENDSRGVVCKGDRNALRHAISEVMLNALQANPDDAQVGVRALPKSRRKRGGLGPDRTPGQWPGLHT